MSGWETFDSLGFEQHIRLDKGVAFVWSGGQYVEVYWSDSLWMNGANATPFTAINVKDMDGSLRVTDRVTFVDECDVWLEASEGDLPGYLEQSVG
jgi:hypothetical protein